MIKFLQSGNKATKYLLAGMLVILCGSMVTYLIPGFMSGSTLTGENVVASVGGVEVSTQDVQKLVNQIQENQRRQRGQAYPEQLLPYLRREAVQELVQTAAIRYEADRLGLTVSDKELVDGLRASQYGEMFFPKGQFVGQERYQQMVQQYFDTTVDDFEHTLRIRMLGSKLVTAATAGVTVTPAEVEKAYKDQHTKVKFDYAVLSMDDIEKQIKPTDAELKTYYDANKQRYENSIPEKRQVRYFLLTDQLAQNKVTVSAAELERYYRENDASFRVPDRVKVRQIQINLPQAGPDGKVDQKAVDAAQAKAADLLKQVKAGGDFAELAKKNSDDPGSKDNGGMMGSGNWLIKGQLGAAAFDAAAFGQNKGQISDVVATEDSLHIIKTEDKETAHQKSLAEVKDSIESILKEQKAQAWLDQATNTALNDARKQGLEPVAAKYGAAVNTSPNPVSRTDVLAGVGPDPQVMSTIFATDQKTAVQSVRTKQGYAIFEVLKIIPASTPTFEAIKDKVAGDFKAEKSSTLFSQKLAELSDRARASHDLQKAAKEQGATVKSSNLVDPSGQVPVIGALTGQAAVAFTMKPGEISGPLNLGRKGAVLAVTDRQEPSLTDDEFAKAKDGVREQLTQQKRQEASDLFITSLPERLEKEGKVKTNKAVMDSLLKTGKS